MRKSRLFSLLLAASLVLSACGTAPAPNPGDPDPGTGPGNPDPGNPPECRETITGNISVPTRFENGPEECDYYFPEVDRQYRVTAEMLIEPGTVLRFARDAILMVTDSGSLQAVGTPDERIRFEGQLNTTGYWAGICFADNRASRLENVDVLWAGKVYLTGSGCRGAISGMVGSSEPVDIVNVQQFGSHTNGLNAHDLVLGEFSGNAFGGNLDYGVAIQAQEVEKLDAASDYVGTTLGRANSRPFIHVGGTLNEPGREYVWIALNAPYTVDDYSYGYSSSLFVDGGALLLLEKGVHIYFGADTALNVWNYSGLGTYGAPDNPVVLSGLRETRGAWNGVWANESSVELINTRILWAGNSSALRSAGLQIDGVDDTMPKWINGLHVEGSESCGIRLRAENALLLEQFENVTYDNNAQDYCGPPM